MRQWRSLVGAKSGMLLENLGATLRATNALILAKTDEEPEKHP
jgi:hypothetical protein